jgi:hypothetical protein
MSDFTLGMALLLAARDKVLVQKSAEARREAMQSFQLLAEQTLVANPAAEPFIAEIARGITETKTSIRL